MDILQIEHVTKSFGSHKIIDDLSFSVPEQSVFGFLGVNGAGKTTTMKIILGLLRAEAGKIHICGETVGYGETNTNRYIGYLPDVPEFYGYMKPKEYLSLCGEITGMERSEISKKSKELLELVGLEKANKKISSFSRGMKQRLGIAQALLNSPKLLICDEPTSALDPIGRKELLDILQNVKGKTTVLFSTHILPDAERICDRVAVLHQGKVALSGTFSELKSKNKQDSLSIEFKNKDDLNKFTSLHEIIHLLKNKQSDQKSNVLILQVKNIDEAFRLIIRSLLDHNILPLKLEVLEPTLESLFMEVVQ